MDIFNDITKAKNAMDVYEKTIIPLQQEYDTLMQKIQKCSSDLKQAKDIFAAWNKYLKQRIGYVVLASKYDCAEIGPIIAKLISSIEGEEFVYYKANYTEVEKQSNRWGTDTDYDEYDAYLIAKAKDARNYYEENKGSSFLIDSKDMLVLKLNNKFGISDTNISFYDSNAERVINVKRFSYVYDFIDYVIDQKIQQKVLKITAEELEELLNKFLSDYKLGDYAKKIE